MTEETRKQDSGHTTGHQPGKPTPIGEAVGAGAFDGAVAGLAAHYLARWQNDISYIHCRLPIDSRRTERMGQTPGFEKMLRRYWGN